MLKSLGHFDLQSHERSRSGGIGEDKGCSMDVSVGEGLGGMEMWR